MERNYLRTEYKISEKTIAREDFRESFGMDIGRFHDGQLTKMFQRLKIDIVKLDEAIIKIHGNYDEEGKSMVDIVLEKYGEKALSIMEALT
jgi:hypothetical protein